MRIALVSDTYTPQVNGVTTVLRRIVEVLGAAHHHAVVVAPEYPTRSGYGAAELRVPSMAFPPYPAIRLSLPATRRVARFLGDFAPDVVHVATEGPLGWTGRRWALRRGVPLMTSYHTNFPQYCHHYGVPSLEPAAWHWITRFHRDSRLIHAPGAAVRAALLARGLSQVVVWGNGVDTAFFHHARRDHELRRRLGVQDDQLLVLHAGRLAPEKNLAVLAEAFCIAHDALGRRARFVIAGEGPRGERLRRALPFAIHLGFMPRGDLATLYASSDLCVLPSATETCGLVALEAMASGVPVIAAQAGGLAESIAPHRTGLLVPPDDARVFAAAIVELAIDEPARHGMATAARVAAMGRDVTDENEELLAHYAAVGGFAEGTERWRAA